MKIKRFNQINENNNDKNVIKHYFVRQKMEVKDIIRKQGDGKEVIINSIGTIKGIKDFGDDIAYEVEFPITIEHGSAFSDKKWSTDTNIFNIFHGKESKNIVRVF
jgi:hypothetical protein